MILRPLVLRRQQSLEGLPVFILSTARLQHFDDKVRAGMERYVSHRQPDFSGHLGQPSLDHWIKQRAGFTGRIQELDDVHLGSRVTDRRRMFTGKRRCPFRKHVRHRLRLFTLVHDGRRHQCKNEKSCGNQDKSATIEAPRVEARIITAALQASVQGFENSGISLVDVLVETYHAPIVNFSRPIRNNDG